MRNVNVLGIVFPNRHDACLTGLTALRSMGSVPFGGRYRLIDFVLSNMVNAGVSKVGIATMSRYQSLMDHLGSGKAWDLDRKNGGLYFLPTRASNDAYAGRVSVLDEMRLFLSNSKEEYVLLSDCNVVGNIDYAALIQQHIDNGADITVACKGGDAPQPSGNLLVRMNEAGELTDVRIGEAAAGDAWSLGLFVVRRELLLELVREANSRNQDDFERDILQRRLGELRLFGYTVPEYTLSIVSLESYFNANMALLASTVRRQLFLPHRRIYTKVRDCAPAVYGLHAAVSDSLVADGAVVEGAVTRSVLFRDVKVGRDVCLENCVVMQGSEIDGNARLNYVICDKNTRIGDAVALQGVATYPVYVKKNMKV